MGAKSVGISPRQGRRPSDRRWRAFFRYLISATISTLVFGLGYWWMLWDKDNQTWQDKSTHTVVVGMKVEVSPAATEEETAAIVRGLVAGAFGRQPAASPFRVAIRQALVVTPRSPSGAVLVLLVRAAARAARSIERAQGDPRPSASAFGGWQSEPVDLERQVGSLRASRRRRAGAAVRF